MNEARIYIGVAITLLIAWKTIDYARRFRHKPMHCWLYFNSFEIVYSSGPASRKSKSRQNMLSVIAFLFAGILVLTFFL